MIQSVDRRNNYNRVILEVQQLTKTYQMGQVQVNALNGVNLSISEGEFVAIMGHSGSGKTTLLNLIGGLDTASSGAIFIEGKDITKMKDHTLTSIRRTRMGFIFQSYNLIPVLSAAENVELPLKITKVSMRDRKKRVENVMTQVKLQDRMKNKPNQLSGGQQQRVSIARALVLDPALILADEPTGALDSTTGDEIINLIQNLNSQLHKTIVMVTHDRKVAEFASRILFMKDGQIITEEYKGHDY